MTSLATQTALWKSMNNDFCDRLKKEMVQNLLHCFPYKARIIVNPNPYMPWLEAVANGLKANTIHGNSLASATTWKKYTFTKMPSIMRSTAGLSSYMNDPEVPIQQRYGAIQADPSFTESIFVQSGVQVTGGMNSIYTNFICGVMGQFSTRLSTVLDTMITFWDNAVKKIDPAKPKAQVAINFGIVVATAKPTVDVSTINLSSLQDFIVNHGVTWWSRLRLAQVSGYLETREAGSAEDKLHFGEDHL
ncbi:hypothetical protein C8R43DRAFT_959861 [Mycena crocata]|nr:hypothetical protein C8R43DRAFT_959861 [Mycena crocata]